MILIKKYKWVILLSFLALIFLPKFMPTALLKWAVIIIFGGLCLVTEYASLKEARNKIEVKQTWFLILLTMIMIIVTIMI